MFKTRFTLLNLTTIFGIWLFKTALMVFCKKRNAIIEGNVFFRGTNFRKIHCTSFLFTIVPMNDRLKQGWFCIHCKMNMLMFFELLFLQLKVLILILNIKYRYFGTINDTINVYSLQILKFYIFIGIWNKK